MHYRSDIQGLRAIAVLAVMLFHFNPTWLPGGFVGVDVFLVISGFLVFSILLNKKAQPNYVLKDTIKYFYGSRFKRIVPAYFSMLILVSFASAVLFLPQDLATYKQGFKNALWFNSNNFFAGFGDYFAPANHEQPLLHTWSLAVEIQFYLLAPFLILLLPRTALKWILLAVFVGLLALAEYRLHMDGTQQATYYGLYARLPEFLAGGLVALFHARRSQVLYVRDGWLANFGLILIMIAVMFQPKIEHFPGLPVLLPTAGAAFMLLQAAKGRVQQILGSQLMVWLGELSYSLYLWHWPVLALLRYYTGEQLLDLPLSLLFVMLTLLLGAASFYGVETPLRMHRTYTIKQALSYGFLAMLVFGTSKSIAKVNQAFSPPLLPIEYQRYADPATICHGQIVRDCLKGNLTSSKEVLVLGDSHAAMLNIFFDQLGKEYGFKARIITASSCVTIPGFNYQRLPEWAQPDCRNQIKEAQVYIEQAKTIIIASMWSYQFEDEKFRKTMQDFLDRFASNGSVYILSQVPLFNKNPMRIRRLNQIGFKSVGSRNNKYLETNDILKDISNKYKNVKFLELNKLPLFDEAPMHQGVFLYYDESHMNEKGILKYSEQATNVFNFLLNEGKERASVK
jgi:peptidoglycan/LPS O-acetylase OafA/YrhL